MTNQPFSASALRGAVDLSGLAAPRPGGAQASRHTGPASGAAPAGEAGSAPVRQVSDENVAQLLQESMQVPVIVVLWATQMAGSRDHVADVARVAGEFPGRFVIAEADVDANPGLFQAFQVRAVPMVVALIAGRPAPLYEGEQPDEQVRMLFGELVKMAVANGMTGRAEGPVGERDAGGDAADGEEEPLPPLHQKAFDALDRDDLDGAAAAFAEALEADPEDDQARLALAQVELMRRVKDVDPQAARAAAAAAPADVTAQCLVADLDVMGGHVEDAFARMVDTVKITSGQDRDAAREHLLGLFECVGSGDERVRKGRNSLMAALF